MTNRYAFPLFDAAREIERPPSAKSLSLSFCSIEHARQLIAAWHSRLPNTQSGPWQYAFMAEYSGITYAVALWHNPSARMIPAHYLELRRMAVAPDAPHCTASWFLGAMARWFKKNTPERERLISYQDNDVHKGRSTKLPVGGRPIRPSLVSATVPLNALAAECTVGTSTV